MARSAGSWIITLATLCAAARGQTVEVDLSVAVTPLYFASMAAERVDIPVIIDGKEIRTGRTEQAVMPHDHAHVLADWHTADATHVADAITAATAASREWAAWRWEDRAAVFLRAADLLATTWRSTLNAATMLGQSKTIFQSEIDAACEMADFWRFNVHFASELVAEQPISGPGVWNQTDYRGLEEIGRAHV